MKEKTIVKNYTSKITPEAEQTMRVLANLIIDRIFEDKKNGKLNFQRIGKTGRNKAQSSIKYK